MIFFIQEKMKALGEIVLQMKDLIKIKKDQVIKDSVYF